MPYDVVSDAISEEPSQRRLKVFLCHADEDKATVRKTYAKLRADGFEPWLAEEDLLPGQNWRHEIPRVVQQSDVVVVFLSDHSVGKAGFVQKEIKLALDVLDEQPEGAIFLIPARLDECQVPSRLSELHYVDLFTNSGYGKLRKALGVRAENLGLSTYVDSRARHPDQKPDSDSEAPALPSPTRSDIADRFTRAIEQLEDQRFVIRLGAVYELERIAKSSEDYHPTVMEFLCAYLRDKSPYSPSPEVTAKENSLEFQWPAKDIEPVLIVLARRKAEWDKESLNLRAVNLAGVKLPPGADLIGANLSWSDLSCTHLDEAILSDADLRGARIIHSSLIRADLTGVDLGFATLRAVLIGARLIGADFNGAKLAGTDLRSANLTDARNLRQDQIDVKVGGNAATQIPLDLKRPSYWD